MKKLFTYFFFSLFLIAAQAQVSTPNNGVKWNLDSLVLHSAGAVTQVGSEYLISESITLAVNDTFAVVTNEIVRVADSAEIVLAGVALFNAPDSLVITATDSTAHFPAMEIRNSSTVFQNVHLTYGGGIGIYDASPLIIFSKLENNKNKTTGAINLFRSNAVIAFSSFYDNYSAAISGGANIANAPLILSNHFARNVTYNGNKSQILLGQTGSDTAMIIGNHIEGLYTRAGGISVLPLGTANIVIDSNIIEGNRYGIGMLTGGINSLIINNIIRNNNIEGKPALGGSGLNFAGSASNTSIISNNTIYGNLWGVTIQGTAKPNLGDLRAASYNVGQNEIYDNLNSSTGVLEEYAIFNNTPDSIWAQNNIWHQPDSAGVESIISHNFDDSTLGVVTYMPVNIITALLEVQDSKDVQIFPNPSNGRFFFDATDLKSVVEVRMYDVSGKEVKRFTANPGQRKALETTDLKAGFYFLNWIQDHQSISKKLIIK